MPDKELKERILAKYGTEAEMARRLGWPRQRLNKITNGAKEPDVDELAAISKGLCLSISCVANFFLKNSHQTGNKKE